MSSNGKLEIPVSDEVFPRLLGVEDANLRYIAGHFKSRLTARNGVIMVEGPAAERDPIRRVFTDLAAMLAARSEVSLEDIDTVLRLAGVRRESKDAEADKSFPGVQLDTPRGAIKPRNAAQARYIRMMNDETVVFAIGPAGTGKTYLAVAMAVDLFLRRSVEKIILVRPVVESGETLGFLPGDILEKVDPYFRPLYDALDDMLTHERVRRHIERGYIEIAPLAYMRGRTLNNAAIILDEAQNTSSGQMKMFLTRLGVSSRTVLTGDITQIDLPEPGKSGLLEARELLKNITGIGFMEFDDNDIVRHPLVARILKAYETNGIKHPGDSD